MIMKAEKSHSAVCNLETQKNWWCNFSPSLKTRGADGENPSPRAREDQCPSSVRQVEGKRDQFLLHVPFCSIQMLHGLDDAHLHWEGNVLY